MVNDSENYGRQKRRTLYLISPTAVAAGFAQLLRVTVRAIYMVKFLVACCRGKPGKKTLREWSLIYIADLHNTSNLRDAGFRGWGVYVLGVLPRQNEGSHLLRAAAILSLPLQERRNRAQVQMSQNTAAQLVTAIERGRKKSRDVKWFDVICVIA